MFPNILILDNLINMKIVFIIVVLFFSSSVVAEDISNFEIEGMSIGDSALNFFNENEIKKNSKNYYKNNQFTPVQNDGYPFFNTYDAIDFQFKTGDSKYIIHSLSGILIYTNNIDECYPKMNQIVYELKNIFKNADFDDIQTTGHPNDPEGSKGTSKITDAYFYLETGIISVACYDYSKAHNNQDHLSVSIDTYEFNDWLFNKAYK